MIKELLIKLNVIIQQFKNSSDSYEQTIQKDIVDEKTSTTETALKKDINIVVSEQNNIHKIEISDFISPWDYEEIKNSSSKYKALDKLCSFVLWNSSRQKVNKGTYYIINKDNILYNILFTDKEIIIDERTTKELDDYERYVIFSSLGVEQNGENRYFIQDRCLEFNPSENIFYYSSLKHMEDGDTYYTKYYSKDKKSTLETSRLIDDDAYDEINSIISNLEEIDEVKTILDINLLKDHILNGIKENIPKKLF